MDWPVRDRLRLYTISHEAFRLGKGASSFREIYDELVRPARSGGWGIARKAAGPLWTSDRTFEVLSRDFPPFAWGGEVTLLNIMGSPAEAKLLPLLEKMRTFKPISTWPVMAVSKVLHPYNGELFPVYDNEVIKNKVLRCFRAEFKAFCRTSSPPYDAGHAPIFYRNYMRWGNSLLTSAHPRFMRVFAEWLGNQAAVDMQVFDAARLYATAFEFTIIGAYADLNGCNKHVPKSATRCAAGCAA